ncbi:MAG: phosphatase PAP2 family protein [Dehalococcoidia bacterium]|nr:phosphatase PAP2 family protein [Dehalococcoidia bacterium]
MRPTSLRNRPAGAQAASGAPWWVHHRGVMAAQALLLLLMTASVVTRLWSDYPWLGWSLVGLTAFAWSWELRQARHRRWWFVYVFGIFVYTILRSYADETFIPIQTEYVVDFDQLLPGREPVTWLQERWFDQGNIDWLDWATVAVHWSFFIAPHLGAVLVYLYRRVLFARYAALMVSIMWLGLALFFLLPTTPPWLAGVQGDLPGVVRVMDFVGGEVTGSTYEDFHSSLAEPNSVAAMPSIHMAITFAMFLWAWAYERRPLAYALLLYSAAMAFSLMYLGEHYAADELAGVACAAAAWWAIRRWWPRPEGPAAQAAR